MAQAALPEAPRPLAGLHGLFAEQPCSIHALEADPFADVLDGTADRQRVKLAMALAAKSRSPREHPVLDAHTGGGGGGSDPSSDVEAV